MIARLICFLRVIWKRKTTLNSYCNSSWKRLGQKMSKKKQKEKKIQKEVWKLVGGQHLGWSIRWRLTFFVLILIFPQKLSIGSFSSSLLLFQTVFFFDGTFLLHTSSVKVVVIVKLNFSSHLEMTIMIISIAKVVLFRLNVSLTHLLCQK